MKVQIMKIKIGEPINICTKLVKLKIGKISVSIMLSTIAFVTLKLFWQNSGKISIIGAAMVTSKLRNNEKTR